jgi:hypothetical protein
MPPAIALIQMRALLYAALIANPAVRAAANANDIPFASAYLAILAACLGVDTIALRTNLASKPKATTFSGPHWTSRNQSAHVLHFPYLRTTALRRVVHGEAS